MTITIPNTTQIGAGAERIARALAVAVAVAILAAQLTYEAGYALGRILHHCNDWLARAVHSPAESVVAVATAVDKALTPAPAPVSTFAQVLAAEGIRPLTPAELEAEIAKFDTQQQAKPAARRKATPRPAARRKSAGGTRVKVAA
jgi:hypothetical protein